MTQTRLAWVFLLISAVSSLHAQTSATLSGTVTDSSGAVLSAADVTIKNVDTGAVRSAASDAAGLHQVGFIGQYEVHAAKSGFSEAVRSGINLVVGQSATVDLSLSPGQASQQVNVNADAPLVSVTTADISGPVGGQQIRDLPLNGRSYDELLTLNPGVVNFTWEKFGGIGVSNSTSGNNFCGFVVLPQQNLFLLNGVEFTGAAENNMQPGGTSQQLLGVDAVREFNALRDTYGAEYGKRPGAQVVIVTRGGGNEVHGSVYEFLRNNAMDARNFFDPGSAPGFQRNQYGVALGGPVKKDKTFLFGNFEGFNQHLHQTGVDLVPDTNARNGYLPCTLVTPAPTNCSGGLSLQGVSPLINAWPAPSAGAPDFGGISEAFNNPLQTIHDYLGTMRMDHIVSKKDWLSAIYTVDDSADFTPTSFNSYTTDSDSLREQVASLQHTHVFSPTVLNSATIGYSRAGYFFTGEPTPGNTRRQPAGFAFGRSDYAVVGGSAASNPTATIALAGANNGSNLHLARNIFTYEDHVSVTKGRHHLSVGASIQRLESNELLALSQRRHPPASKPSCKDRNAAVRSRSDAAGMAVDDGRVYAQDSIRLSSKLTVTLGFRDEFTNGWNESHAPPPPPTRSRTAPPYLNLEHRIVGIHRQPSSCRSRAWRIAWSPTAGAQDRSPRGLRHVQRFARCAGLSHGPERPVQSHL